MKLSKEIIYKFIRPYYKDKDIMHDLSHLERVEYTLNKLLSTYEGKYNKDIIDLALYFHGFIYSHESTIREWMVSNEIKKEMVEEIIKVAWESQKDLDAETIEGKLLHDAHMIEGGRTFGLIKSLITGSVRGQSLEETIKYIEDNVDEGECYLPESKEMLKKQNEFTKEIIAELKSEVGYG